MLRRYAPRNDGPKNRTVQSYFQDNLFNPLIHLIIYGCLIAKN
ncbi:hypothetical protein SC020_15280 [Legionella pneumophila serogroup 1]